MSDMVPVEHDLPTAGGGEPGFLALAGRVTVLTSQALALKEGLASLQRQMNAASDKAGQLSEMTHLAEVEEQFTVQILETATALKAVAEASGEVAGAADTMQTDAQQLYDAHQAEYGGTYEAVQASGVRQPKPAFLENR